MTGTCKDLFDLVPETIVLAFDVAGWTTPADAARIARSKDVVAAMNKELAEQGRKLILKHYGGKAITSDDALNMLSTAGGKFLDDRKRVLGDRLKCAYNDSPLGVWLDKHEWVLYVFAPLIVGGAGTWMYVARVGDTPANWVLPMANVRKDWTIQKLGKITLGTSDVRFVPSKHELSGKVFSVLELDRLSIGLAVGAGMSEDRFIGASAKIDVSGKVARDLTLGTSTSLSGLGVTPKGTSSVDLKYAGSGAGVNMSLSVSGLVDYDPTGATAVGGSGSVGLKRNVFDAPASLDVTGSVKHGLQGSAPPTEFNALLTLTVGW